MALTGAPVEWRFCMTACGERCVTMSGTSGMLRWCAEPWTVARLRQPNLVPSSVKAMETSGWMTLAVSVTRRPFYTASIPALEKTTVAMAKMPVWCAQVSPQLLLYLISLSNVTKQQLAICWFSVLCFPASIRLINGTNQCSGRVEFHHGDQWSTAYNNNWGMNEATVVCREMNCGDPVKFSGSFGQSGDLTGYTVSCRGTESSITQCTLRQYTRTSHDRIEEAAVECSGKTWGWEENLNNPTDSVRRKYKGTAAIVHIFPLHSSLVAVLQGKKNSTSTSYYS